MNNQKKNLLWTGLILLAAFVLWTVLIRTVDVKPAGPEGSLVGFAAFNTWFHELTGINMTLYTITDWLGLVPILVCLCFGVLGLYQLIRRKSLLKVDADILLLGVYYILVIFCYIFFEMVPINYRPVLIEGVLETSYPSSTTLLVLSVMPTLKFQTDRRSGNLLFKKVITIFVVAFSAFIVIGRVLAGVHWATDILGGVLLGSGLFILYVYSVRHVNGCRAGRHQGT